jgi:hypothetical protein
MNHLGLYADTCCQFAYIRGGVRWVLRRCFVSGLDLQSPLRPIAGIPVTRLESDPRQWVHLWQFANFAKLFSCYLNVIVIH